MSRGRSEYESQPLEGQPTAHTLNPRSTTCTYCMISICKNNCLNNIQKYAKCTLLLTPKLDPLEPRYCCGVRAHNQTHTAETLWALTHILRPTFSYTQSQYLSHKHPHTPLQAHPPPFASDTSQVGQSVMEKWAERASGL